MTDELKLICLVAGEPASNAFSVKASSALIVDELKGLIKVKKAPEFDDFAADKITLWRASIHVNPANKHKPIVLDDIESKTELDPTDNISDVFDESPPKKTIQIIVQRPLPGIVDALYSY
ncbi:hypothetical protein BGX28_003687 [Mortierella sp. GBA30]|nr:hypothetical protein BGX28_003687 [Mortierella sp. GBA30]